MPNTWVSRSSTLRNRQKLPPVLFCIFVNDEPPPTHPPPPPHTTEPHFLDAGYGLDFVWPGECCCRTAELLAATTCAGCAKGTQRACRPGPQSICFLPAALLHWPRDKVAVVDEICMVSGLQQRWGGPCNTPQLLAAEHILLVLANSPTIYAGSPQEPRGR